MKPLIVLIMILVAGCVRDKKPHFASVDPNYLKMFDFTMDYIDTLVSTDNYALYHIGQTHDWDADHYYLLQNKYGLFRLEPANNIANGTLELHLIDDSTLVFYNQFHDRFFGDSWVTKNGKLIDVKLDPGIISNTDKNDLVYRRGRLKEIGDLIVDIDSVALKKNTNKLFRLFDNELRVVSEYKNLKDDISSLPDGVYYFSYPGRHILDTLHLY